MSYREIILDKLTKIGGGVSGSIYRLDNDRILKVYDKGFDEAMMEKFMGLSNNLLNNGITTAKTYEIVKVEDAYGLIQEFIDGKPLSHVIAGKGETRNDAAKKMGELLKKIHSLNADESFYMSLEEMTEGIFRRFEHFLTSNEKERLFEVIRRVPGEGHVLHGDFHEANIMVRDSGYCLIDLDSMCIGSPVFEFMQLFCIYEAEIPEEMQAMVDLRPDQIKEFLNILLRTYFDTENEQFISRLYGIFSRLGSYNRFLAFLLQSKEENRDTVRVRVENEMDAVIETSMKTLEECKDIF